MANRRKDFTGQVVGRLTVLGAVDDRSSRGDCLWRVRCTCGKELVKRAADLGRRCVTRIGQAEQSCGCARQSKRVYTSKYGSAGHLTGPHYGKLKTGAFHRGHRFDVSAEYLWQKFVEQEGICVLSGAALALTKKTALPGEAVASLDRIDSETGYIPGNVQWVHPTVNFMKHAMPQEHFIAWCKRVAGHS